MGKIIDYQVRLIKFPPGKVKEAVTKNEDGSYTIFIEESLSTIEQRKEFLHALTHITRNDFSKTDTNEIERNTHNSEIFEDLYKII